MRMIGCKGVGRIVLAAAVMAAAGTSRAGAAPGMAGDTGGSAPAVLSQIPSDATAAVVIGNLKSLGTKISNLGTRLNLTQRFGIPLPPDLVGFASRNLGITKGLDPNGSAALVLLGMTPEELPQLGGPNGPPIVFLIPTTDANGMLSDFSPGAKDADGIEEVTIPAMGDRKTFTAVVADKWVAFSHNHDVLDKYVKRQGEGLDKTVAGLGGSATGAAALQVFSGNDAVVWWNLPAISTVVSPYLDRAQEQVSEGMDLANMSANQPAITAAMQKAMFSVYFQSFRAVLHDGAGAMTTLRLSDAGVTFGNIAVMKEGSEAGKVIAALPLPGSSAKDLTLNGLPGGGFLAAAVARLDGAALAGPIGSFGDSLMQDQVISKDPDAPQIQRMITLAKDLVSMQRGVKMVLLDPPAGGKSGLFRGAFLSDVTDPAKSVQLSLSLYDDKQLVAVLQKFSPTIVMTPTIVRDAVTIKGVKLTKVQMEYKLPEATADHPAPPGAEMGLDMIKHMYGPDGMTMYVGVVGKRVLTVIGAEPGVLEGAVAAAQADSDELDAVPAVAAEKREISKDAIGVAYAPMGKWAALFGDMLTAQMQMSGDAAPPWVRMMGGMQDAPPMLVNVRVTGTLAGYEVHVPVGDITSVMDLMMRARSGQRGGAEGAPAGGMP